MENSNKHLFQICMEGNWNEVVDIYKKEKSAHTAIITRAGDTALHVAVTDGQEDVVAQLVEVVQQHTPGALGIQNKRQNTALHFAASVGTVKMIQDIADADPSLVSVRNVDGETPLFLAALHGRKEAFKILHDICNKDKDAETIDYSNCGRNDGDTILHCAIAADNFDIAFQIIHLYGELVNWVNEKGASPLHILASKPSAFKSGSRLGRFERLIYYGISVEDLKAESNDLQQSKATDEDKNGYPKNYQTCVDFKTVMYNAVSVVIEKSQKDHTQTQTQRENSEAQEKTTAKRCQEKLCTNFFNGGETNLSGSEAKAWRHPLFPINYNCCVDLLKFIFVVVLIIFGKDTTIFTKMRRKKEKHVWSVQIMNDLLKRASMYEFDGNGSSEPPLVLKEKETSPYSAYKSGTASGTSDSITEEQQPSKTKGEAHQKNKGDKKDEGSEKGKEMETPILIAAKNGVTEMVERILDMFPVAVHDRDANRKNILLLALENRQLHLYQLLLLKKKSLQESLIRTVDDEANSALHLAAKLRVGDYNESWVYPVAAMQMHWEIKWFLFIKESMPPHFFRSYNEYNKTPGEIFTHTHKELVQRSGEWLKRTSESCSVVAALIATVAFATSTTVPGGVHEETGIPTLEARTAYKVFNISSLIALAGSVNSVVLFLSILASRFQERDFSKSLPRKLVLGLTSMFVSLTSMLVSFCAGHFLGSSNKLRFAAIPIYAVTCLPVTIFAMSHFSLYLKLIWSTFDKVPPRSYVDTPL